MDIPNKSVNIIAEHCNKASEINLEAVVAIVADVESIFSLAKMWDMLCNKSSWEKKVFRKKEEAEVWIKKRVKEKYDIDNLTLK